MRAAIRRELKSLYCSFRIGLSYLRRGFLHCNLHITHRCNFRCEICDYWREGPGPCEELTVDEVRLISRKLWEFTPMAVSIAGGEPLLRMDICDVIAAISGVGHITFMTTNGWFVDAGAAKGIWRAGLSDVWVSVDHADPAKHDAVRGRVGAWERAVQAIEHFVRHRPGRRCRVHMIATLAEDNLEEIEPLIRLAAGMGATLMTSLYCPLRGEKSPLPQGRRVADRLCELKRRYPEFTSPTSYIERFDEAIARGGIGDCQAGVLHLNVGPRGGVSRCLDRPGEIVGNILTESVAELRRRLIRTRAARPCAECWVACRGFNESMYKPPRLRQLREMFLR